MKTRINIGDNSRSTQVVVETFADGKQVITTGPLPMSTQINKQSPIKSEMLELSQSDAKRLAENPDKFVLKKGRVEKASKKRVG